jgi:hypothetical protein
MGYGMRTSEWRYAGWPAWRCTARSLTPADGDVRSSIPSAPRPGGG